MNTENLEMILESTLKIWYPLALAADGRSPLMLDQTIHAAES